MVASSPASFFGDLRATLNVWVLHPLLPLLSLSVNGAMDLIDRLAPRVGSAPRSGATEFLYIVLSFFGLLVLTGWVGTERIWYLRAFGGRRMAPGEVWRFTWRMVGRFVRLGILALIGLVPLFLLAGVHPFFGVTAFLVLVLGIDVMLTFTTPALAYTTNSAWQALRIGLWTLRTHWPASAAYALVPPFAFFIAAYAFDLGSTIWSSLAATLVPALGNLWFKGATARFYLRRYETDPDFGALYERHPPAEQRDGSKADT